MQMRIRILPYYNRGFKETFPKIAHSLRHVKLVSQEENPSLFSLVGHFDTVLHTLEADAPVRRVFMVHREKLKTLYEEVEEQIADWQLAKADQALYKIEDIFDDIEKELGKI